MNAFGNLTLTFDTIIVEAYLKVGFAPRYERPAGVAENAIVMKGYAVSPMQIPSEINRLAIATVVMPPHTGNFTLDDNITNAPFGRAGVGSILERNLGTAIGGWFVITGKADA